MLGVRRDWRRRAGSSWATPLAMTRSAGFFSVRSALAPTRRVVVWGAQRLPARFMEGRGRVPVDIAVASASNGPSHDPPLGQRARQPQWIGPGEPAGYRLGTTRTCVAVPQ